jgi:hypothetical protein
LTKSILKSQGKEKWEGRKSFESKSIISIHEFQGATGEQPDDGAETNQVPEFSPPRDLVEINCW